jgi:hypothetical protein
LATASETEFRAQPIKFACGIRKTRQEEGPQKCSFNVFHAVTSVRVDGWAFRSSEKRPNEWKLFKYSCEEGKV